MSINLSNLIVTIALALIPIIGGYATSILKKHKEIVTLIQVLEPLAKDAVVAMQKLGVNRFISGDQKKDGAVYIVKQALLRLNLSTNGEALITNAVEKEYALLIDNLNTVYPQVTEAQQEANDAEAKAEELAKAQQALTDAQAKVSELQK